MSIRKSLAAEHLVGHDVVVWRRGVSNPKRYSSLARSRAVASAWVACAFVVAGLLAVAAARPGVPAALPLRTQTVPVALQSLAQRVIGASDAKFAIRRERDALFTAWGGGVASVFSSSGLRLRVAGGTTDLRLTGLGYGDRFRAVAAAVPVAAGNVVRYRRSGLTEWYRNGPFGLEQGFTLRARPQAGAGPLTLALSAVGSLHARQSGSGVGFVSAAGRVALLYGGLRVVDAVGRDVRAALAVSSSGLLVRVWDRAARYPLRIDPLIQQGSKLTAAGESGPVYFGYDVALTADGNTALIGGVGADNRAGAAWVFTRSGSTWTQGAKLTASDESGAGQFGQSVSLSADGNTALIGGPADGSAGAAWVFTRANSTWTQQGAKLTPDDSSGSAQVGFSVRLSADGNTALVGGPADNNNVGSAWVFTRSGSAWLQQGAKLTGSDTSGQSHFGGIVALSADGSTALIGGPFDGSSVGHNTAPGAAWVFTRSANIWTQQGAKLTPNDESGPALFGTSAALSGDGNTALIGGHLDNPSSSNQFQAAGAGWVFTRSASTWIQQGPKLTANDESGSANLGTSAALSADGNTALLGGSGDNGNAGAAWLFGRSGGTWTQQGPKLYANDESGAASFGSSTALSADGTTAVIGGLYDNTYTGAAWVFAVNLPTSKDQCKQGGWQSYGVFKDQGDCVSYIATSGKNPSG